MLFKATNLISESFDQHGVKYRVNEMEKASEIEAGFSIKSGPTVSIRFISSSQNNDVAVRVFGLINQVPEEKRMTVMEACNRLSEEIRFVKFCKNSNADVNVEYDFLTNVSDDCIGECCFEIFARLMSILDQRYHVLMETLYSGGQESKSENLREALKYLQTMQKNPISIKEDEKTDTGSNVLPETR